MVRPRVLMLLTNGLSPDPRVEAEARALTRAGAEVTVVCWDRDGTLSRDDLIAGARVRRVQLRSSHGRGSAQAFMVPRVWRMLVAEGYSMKPDIVHAHDLDTLPAGFALAKTLRVPLVFDAHESYPDMLGKNVAGSIKRACRLLERALVPRVDLLVTVGERLRLHYEAMGATRTAVVGNWRDPVEDAAFPDARGQLRKTIGVGGDDLLVCFIANLTPERRLGALLDAVESMNGVHVAVGGLGSEAALAEDAARRCSRVHYLGLVASKDVGAWTAASDVVYYGFDPDNRNAQFSAPNKLFEALAAGIPVITAKFGEIGEIVEKTRCGVLVKEYSKEAIRAALEEIKEPERRAHLCAAACTARSRYTRRAADRALIEAYLGLRGSATWTFTESRPATESIAGVHSADPPQKTRSTYA